MSESFEEAPTLPLTLPSAIAHRKADIYSEGVRISADVYSLETLSARVLPTIIMAAGWGGTASGRLRPTAIDFALAGFFVVAFDYRGWGDSDSRVILTSPPNDRTSRRYFAEVQEVREVVDPWEMLTDWLNAIHWVHGEPQCDTTRIGLWGTSYSGGLVVAAAVRDPRVKAIVSQVGAFGYTLLTHAGEHVSRAYEEAVKRTHGQMGYPAPLVPEVGNLLGGPIREKMTYYDPSDEASRAPNCAMLFVLAENEELFDNNDHGIKAHELAKGPKKLVIMPKIRHYGIYSEGQAEAAAIEIEWFNQHLKPRP